MTVTDKLLFARNMINSWYLFRIPSLLHVDIHWQHLLYLDEMPSSINNYVFFGAELQLSYHQNKDGHRLIHLH